MMLANRGTETALFVGLILRRLKERAETERMGSHSQKFRRLTILGDHYMVNTFTKK